MRSKCVLAAGAALVVLAVLPVSLAVAGTAASVTVRVEGLNRELLAPTAVKVHAGSLTRFGAPSGKCPDQSAAGALDAATRHRWKGTWESSFSDYEVTSILGETHTFSSKKDYWEVFVNNVAAQTGACEITIKPGEQILFAAVPQTGPAESVLQIDPPTGRAAVGHPFDVLVRALRGHRLVDVGGAHVTGAGASATTNDRGEATLVPRQRGNAVLHASKAGYIRGAAIRLVS